MDWLNGTLADAVKLAASKAVLARVKRADAATEAEKGRRTLGYLGVPEDRVNSLTKQYQEGSLSRPGALGRLMAGGPMRIPGQIANVPASVGTALNEGDLGGAASQADVLGWKNINPATNPITATTALTAGATGAALGRHMQNNRDIKRLLNNSYDEKDPLSQQLFPKGEKGEKPLTGKASLQAYRDAQPANVDKVQKPLKTLNRFRTSYQTAGVPGVLARGKKELQRGLESLKGPRMPTGVPRSRVEAVLQNQRNAKGGPGIRKPLLMGAAAASIPLAAREWLHPTGYRSGVNPFSKVLDANDPKRETR